jgi:hypothetical protein
MAEDTMYLTIKDDKEKGGMIAVISMGHPQLGDKNVNVLDVNRVPDKKAAEEWYERMKLERPWETRQ